MQATDCFGVTGCLDGDKLERGPKSRWASVVLPSKKGQPSLAELRCCHLLPRLFLHGLGWSPEFRSARSAGGLGPNHPRASHHRSATAVKSAWTDIGFSQHNVLLTSRWKGGRIVLAARFELTGATIKRRNRRCFAYDYRPPWLKQQIPAIGFRTLGIRKA